MLENILVVDLTSGGFLSSGIVANLKVGDFVPGKVDIGDEVSFVPLHVIDIIKDFAGRAIHGFAKLIGLGGSSHEEVRSVT